MKKLINDVRNVVPEMMEGLVLGNPEAEVLDGEAVAVRRTRTTDVAVVSGGGAGHEPAHVGFVGAGMLTAAVSGEVFTSPSVDAVLAAIHAVGGPAGVLLVVKNYTGDRLNFGLAAELARAEGIPVEMVVVADDVSLPADGPGGRRGIAGTVLVHKIAGAAAAAGASLAQVAREAERAASAVGTMSVALGGCTVPAVGRPGLELGASEIELGLGIHGEAGVERGPVRPADELVADLLDRVVEALDLARGDRVVLLVNGLGGTPVMELAIVARRAVSYLADQGLRLERMWSGSLLTALDMPGCSLSLMKVDDQRLRLLDAATLAPAWPAPYRGTVVDSVPEPAPGLRRPAAAPAGAGAPPPTTALPPHLSRAILAVCEALEAAEPRLTELDRRVGDGDLGSNLARGARAVLDECAGYGSTPAAALRAMAGTVRRSVGGSSGPLYAALLLRAAAVLDAAKSDDAPSTWAAALSEGAAAIAQLGGAAVGDRTMLDALVPAGHACARAVADGASGKEALAQAVAAALQGAAASADLLPRRGRSSYLGERAVGCPDPGAVAVTVWLSALADAVDQTPEAA
ncbi:dihydroxyacetone kinase subunit DhaL [Kitasatospora sp. NPDC008050]|uniref:dihydroxyacetone kinase subunit DhaL n=1 Tax=Kitasatospora sp. NPDC008050 TaxID=3364021 RepID=UPI0036F0C37B